jgi:hypothetical protein
VEPAGGVPKAETGRARPLGYKVYAGADVPGKVVISQRRIVRQDEIDKCRQEYVDMGVGIRSEIVRSAFTMGLHEEYANPQKIKDCYAYIYPEAEAQKVINLRNAGHNVEVTSGYRSPRYNVLDIKSSTNSTHIFGEAVDIRPTPSELNAEGWKALWEADQATCPKSLERASDKIMKLCNGLATETYNGSYYPGSYNAMFPMVTCIHLGNSKKNFNQ